MAAWLAFLAGFWICRSIDLCMTDDEGPFVVSLFVGLATIGTFAALAIIGALELTGF